MLVAIITQYIRSANIIREHIFYDILNEEKEYYRQSCT
jgi:hypothetical protein